jgi:hypothetical protein
MIELFFLFTVKVTVLRNFVAVRCGPPQNPANHCNRINIKEPPCLKSTSSICDIVAI